MRIGRATGALLLLGLTLSWDTPASPRGDDPATFWARERLAGSLATGFDPRPARLDRTRAEIAARVGAVARDVLGPQWVATALKLAKIESDYRCRATGPRTRRGRALGVLQVLPTSAEELEPGSSRRLNDCETGIRVGVAHMKRCLAAGVRTRAQMAACHVAGYRGWKRTLAARAERYKQHYVRLAGAEHILQQGWNAW